jgi:hypothetical protein
LEEGIFRGVQLAQNNRPRRAQMRHHRGIGAGGRDIGARGAIGARRQAAHINHILDANGDAMQGATRPPRLSFRIQRPRFGKSGIGQHMNPGLHLAIHGCDSVQIAVHQGFGGDLAFRHGGGKIADAAWVLDQRIWHRFFSY